MRGVPRNLPFFKAWKPGRQSDTNGGVLRCKLKAYCGTSLTSCPGSGFLISAQLRRNPEYSHVLLPDCGCDRFALHQPPDDGSSPCHGRTMAGAGEEHASALVVPYRAIRCRETISAIRLYCAYGVVQLGVSTWPIGAIPPPPFLSVSPLESMRSGGAIAPHTRRISAILAIPYENKAKRVQDPPFLYYLERVLRDMGGYLTLSRPDPCSVGFGHKAPKFRFVLLLFLSKEKRAQQKSTTNFLAKFTREFEGARQRGRTLETSKACFRLRSAFSKAPS